MMSLQTANRPKLQAQQGLRSRQRGFTAIELFVVIIVGLGIFIYAASNIDKLFGQSSGLEELRNVQQIAVATKTLRSPAGGYGTASLNQALIDSGNIPASMNTGAGGVINNGWGGAVVVTGATTKYTISTANVPKAQCSTLVSKLGTSGLFHKMVKVGTGAAIDASNITAVTTACAAVADAAALEFTALQ